MKEINITWPDTINQKPYKAAIWITVIPIMLLHTYSYSLPFALFTSSCSDGSVLLTTSRPPRNISPAMLFKLPKLNARKHWEWRHLNSTIINIQSTDVYSAAKVSDWKFKFRDVLIRSALVASDFLLSFPWLLKKVNENESERLFWTAKYLFKWLTGSTKDQQSDSPESNKFPIEWIQLSMSWNLVFPKNSQLKSRMNNSNPLKVLSQLHLHISQSIRFIN